MQLLGRGVWQDTEPADTPAGASTRAPGGEVARVSHGGGILPRQHMAGLLVVSCVQGGVCTWHYIHKSVQLALSLAPITSRLKW